MINSIYKYTIIAALPVLLIISGCTGYGKLTLLPKSETDALLEDILSRTDQYVVHYHGNSEKFVSGLLFDPKNDNRHIRPEGALWNEVTDPKAIASTADIILKTREHPNYFPNLFQVTNPQGDFYGYLITGWKGLAINQVEEQYYSLFVLKVPP